MEPVASAVARGGVQGTVEGVAIGFGDQTVAVPLAVDAGFAEGRYRVLAAIDGTLMDRSVAHTVTGIAGFHRDAAGGWEVALTSEEDSPTPESQAATVGGSPPGLDRSTSAAGRRAADWAGAPLSLAGRWRVRLDPDDLGVREGWPARPLESGVPMGLPGTTEQAGLGVTPDPVTGEFPVAFPFTRFPGVKETGQVDALGFLVPRHMHLGPVWYERDIEVPRSWRDRRAILSLERTLWRTDVWVDGVEVPSEGTEDSLAVAHTYRLGRLSPGRRRLLVRVDNRMQVNLSTLTHAYGPETQGRWNGLVGRLEVMGVPDVALRRLEVHPAPDRRSVRVTAVMDVDVDVDDEAGSTARGWLGLELRREGGARRPLAVTEVPVRVGAGLQTVDAVLSLAEPAAPWDEFSPVLHRVDGVLRTAEGTEAKASAVVGFRHLERDGRAIRLNGRRLFLRGTLDCAVYPRTGHPPMDEAEWERVFGAVKAHGFNHVRFHTWCPPEAAFAVADRMGLYLMPEVAAWVDDWTRETWQQPAPLGRDAAVSTFVQAEIRRISEAYGNHPSFAFFCIGNEFGMQGTDWPVVDGWVAEAKARDPRRLYLGSTARRLGVSDDLWVTHSANGKGTRGTGPARTDWDFSDAAGATDRPLVAHETGQRPVFPDYADLIPKFTGPLRPLNYERLRSAVKAAGLGGQVKDFERASARFQAVLYKAEHEAMRRTSDYAGYQLLMLNDFTGQSEALVGILDPFWESKGIVRAAEVRAWNEATVPLARFPRYTWTAGERFTAAVDVAHHGPADLDTAEVGWELRTSRGRRIAGGAFRGVRLPTGALTRVGTIEWPLSGFDVPDALELRVRCGSARNRWPIWVYPGPAEATGPGVGLGPGPGVTVVRRYDREAERVLADGGTVLFLAHGLTGAHAARTGFESVYWSAGWWGNAYSSLGVLCDPRHPALARFPNDGHADWQWEPLLRGATTFQFEAVPAGFRPIVQAVPDFHFNRLLGQVFEARVGPGRLLVCGFDLESNLAVRLAAGQFRTSLWGYMASADFRPRSSFEPGAMRLLLGDLAPPPTR
jgi:hypothetical protein